MWMLSGPEGWARLGVFRLPNPFSSAYIEGAQLWYVKTPFADKLGRTRYYTNTVIVSIS